MRVGTDEAVPDVKHVFDLVSQDLAGEVQLAHVVIVEQHGPLERCNSLSLSGDRATSAVPQV